MEQEALGLQLLIFCLEAAISNAVLAHILKS